MDEWVEEISRAAHIVARKWPGVIDADDVNQEIWVRLLSQKTSALDALDPDARLRTLVRIGDQVAADYRNDHEVFSGNVYYGTDDVRALLKKGLLAKRREDLDAASETLTEFIDLHEGAVMLRNTQPQHAAVVSDVFLFGNEDDDRKRATRAVDALTRCMNRVHTTRYAHEGPGSRRAISNSAGRTAVSKDYNGESPDYQRSTRVY